MNDQSVAEQTGGLDMSEIGQDSSSKKGGNGGLPEESIAMQESIRSNTSKQLTSKVESQIES